MEEQQTLIQQTQNQETAPNKNPFWRKRMLLITLTLLLVFIPLFLYSLSLKKLPGNIFIHSIATPTPISLPVNGYQNVTINTSPQDKSIDNSLFATISATFSRPLSLSEKTYTKIAVVGVSGISSWSSNNTTVTFTPTTHLETNSVYEVKLTYGVTTKTWSFTTIPQTAISVGDTNNIQVQSDENFGDWQNQIYNQYPWYDQLPLQTNEYYTYFNIDSKEFISSLYISPSDTKKIQLLKNEVLQKLQGFGVNTTVYKFAWNITP